MAPVVEQITEPVTLGEGPHWASEQGCLYFVSIFDQTIHKYEPVGGKETRTKLDGQVGFIVPVEGKRDEFVVGVDRSLKIIKWNGENESKAELIKEFALLDPHTQDTRINDAKVDPRGRLFAGTMGNQKTASEFKGAKGSLYRISADGSFRQVCNELNIANGLAWDVVRKAFYYIDSVERRVRRYDYDIDTGEIANKKFIFDFEANGLEGMPDGMTIDTDGNLWVACFGGSKVIKVDPTTGKLLLKLDIPVPQVTSVAFGGENLDILFVTTASLNIKGEQKPPCGATFRVSGLGVKGLPAVSCKVEQL